MEVKTLEEVFQITEEKTPVFRTITDNTYRQLETGMYDIYGRRMNITPRVLDENGIWTGEYKDWSHLEEIKIRQGFFEYLNLTWLFIDQRKEKIHNCICKEAYVFDKLCIVIQELHQDAVFAKILTDDEELKIYIEDILKFKPMSIVPKREIFEINELEHQGLKFGSSQLKINVENAEEKLDKEGNVITNIDHYDNYTYEIYDSLRNIFKHISLGKQRKTAEEKVIWMEEWLDRPLTNTLEAVIHYMTPNVVSEISKYTYRNKDLFDRQTYGSYLFEEVKTKKFSIEEMEYTISYETRMSKICEELDIPITVGWDIWKILNKNKMRKIIKELYEEFPL